MDDHEQLRALVHRYCDAVCSGNDQQWMNTWTEDAVWNIGRGDVNGRVAIMHAYRTAMALFECVYQLTHNGAVAVDGSTATGRWYMTEHGRTRKGNPIFYLAHYDDQYRKCDDGWRFSARILTWHYYGKPDLSGSFGTPPGGAK